MEKGSQKTLLDDSSIITPLYKEIYRESLDNREEFWGILADSVVWYKKWDKVLDDSNKPFYKWYAGGMLNACYNSLDLQIERQYGNRVAIKYDSPVLNEVRYITYKELHSQVTKLAGALLNLGVKMGDCVLIYMPTIPESAMAMLACARIGAIHVQVYGGYNASVLAQRLQHVEAKVLITATYGMDGNEVVLYQPKVEEALKLSTHQPQKCIVYIRPNRDSQPLHPTRDISWTEAIDSAAPCDCVPVEATHPLLILHTSGTTGVPKGVVLPTGGVMVTATSFTNLKFLKTDPLTLWINSNFGWLAGNVTVVYGTLSQGYSTVIYEGKPTGTPDASTFYRVISQHQVDYMFCAPALFRAIRQEDPDGLLRKKYDYWGLKLICTAGEPSGADTQQWIQKAFEPLAVHNAFAQCESGPISAWPVAAGLSMQQPPVTCGIPLPGSDVHILRSDGTDCSPGEIGHLVVRLPLAPGAASTYYNNDELFEEQCLTKFPGFFDTNDRAYFDDQALLYSAGRGDDTIKVSGHRLETTQIAAVVESHPAVVECTVIGKPNNVGSLTPLVLYVAVSNHENISHTISEEIAQNVIKHIGPSGDFLKVVEVPVLPKNINGKILRSTITDLVATGTLKIPPSTENPEEFYLLEQSLRVAELLPQ